MGCTYSLAQTSPELDPLVSSPVPPGIQTCVIVPARNEERLLPRCLRALSEQTTLSGRKLDHSLYEVILLINNTTDQSRAAAEQFQSQHPSFQLHIIERTFPKAQAQIGFVRRLLMDEACRRLKGLPTRPILSTDSDTRVASNWIARNLSEFAAGAEAVGGRIVLSRDVGSLAPNSDTAKVQHVDDLYRRLIAWLETRLDPEPHNPWPRHYQYFGASLGILASTYREVGGLPPSKFLEDIALYNRLVRNDIRIRHSNKVRVFTSPRTSGRVEAGLASKLSEWSTAGQNGIAMPVESAQFLHFLFTTRRKLRDAWTCRGQGERLPDTAIREIASAMRMSGGVISDAIAGSVHFGLLLHALDFYAACRQAWPDSKRMAALDQVVRELFTTYKGASRRHSYSLAAACQSVSANGHSTSVHVATA